MRAANAHSWCGLAVSLSFVLWGYGLRFGTVTCYTLSVFFFLCVVVIALSRNALVTMNWVITGVVCCDVVWRCGV